jgi:hypothetical protein
MTNVTMKHEHLHPQTDAAVSGLPPAGSHQLAWRTRSISSSARASSEGGMSRDSAPGRLSFMVVSNPVLAQGLLLAQTALRQGPLTPVPHNRRNSHAKRQP